jgi:hypothetical protein
MQDSAGQCESSQGGSPPPPPPPSPVPAKVQFTIANAKPPRRNRWQVNDLSIPLTVSYAEVERILPDRDAHRSNFGQLLQRPEMSISVLWRVSGAWDVEARWGCNDTRLLPEIDSSALRSWLSLSAACFGDMPLGVSYNEDKYHDSYNDDY